MTDERLLDERVASQVKKLLNLAANNSSREEAAAAAAKAQELMTRHNLTTAAVERAGAPSDSRREDTTTSGGFYRYARELWGAVAELNFCFYWTQLTTEHGYRRVKKHRLVGRAVNVAATKALAGYLEGAIEREVRRALPPGEAPMGRWANAFREGIADVLIAKVGERFKERLREGTARARAGVVLTGSEVALVDLVKREHDANYDFLNGEGASAARDARRAKAAADAAEREAAYVAWARANPEEARRREEEERKRARRYYRGGTGERTKHVDARGWHAGRAAAANVGLDPQVEQPGGRIGRRR